VGLDDKGHEYDTLEERYQKLKFVCQKFVAFQVGLCTFKWDEELKKYMARPFCFFVFPRSQIND
jgi:poly(A)-specific ribonuclease